MIIIKLVYKYQYTNKNIDHIKKNSIEVVLSIKNSIRCSALRNVVKISMAKGRIAECNRQNDASMNISVVNII